MFAEYFQALTLIFIAEMGDKTQILSMAFATKFKIRQILIGVALGAALNHGLAIAFGTLLSRYVPLELLQLLAGGLFIFFAFWSLQAQEAEEEDVKSAYGPVLTVALAFFLGELGDKTQLTALTLSAGARSPLLILAGTVSGMVLTSLIGILVGIKLGDKIKELHLKIGAFSVFMFFGLQKIFTSPLTGSWCGGTMTAVRESCARRSFVQGEMPCARQYSCSPSWFWPVSSRPSPASSPRRSPRTTAVPPTG